MEKRNFKSKKALAGTGLLMTILAIIGTIALVVWGANYMGGKSSGLSVTPTNGNVLTGSGTIVNVPVDSVTVTFSSWDAYAKGTNAGSGHYVIELGNKQGIQVNDDATQSASPGDVYKVLLGNVTTSLTAGTTYYPVYVTGSLPNQGTFSISTGQYLSGGASQLTFTFFNENGDTNTAAALGTNDQKKVSWKISANDNTCIGNPDTQGQNLMSYTYNTTLYTKVAQLDTSGAEQASVATPTSITAVNGKATKSFAFPTVCDNGDVTKSVLLKTGDTQPSGTQDNINMTVSDVTWDYDADTLVVFADTEDEDNNDIGVADFALAGIIVG